jgi:hypothetical protein
VTPLPDTKLERLMAAVDSLRRDPPTAFQAVNADLTAVETFEVSAAKVAR